MGAHGRYGQDRQRRFRIFCRPQKESYKDRGEQRIPARDRKRGQQGGRRKAELRGSYDGRRQTRSKTHSPTGRGADEKALEKKILREIKARLLKYATPKVVEFRSRLPLTQIGKVDYRKLEERGGENAQL